MTDARIKEIEQKIEEIKRRIPPHSIPPHMLEELENLEEELHNLKNSTQRTG